MKINCISLVHIPDWIDLKQSNKVELEFKDGERWDGDRWGRYVGRVLHDGTIKSAFIKDSDNNNSEIFEKLKNDVKLIEKHVTVMNSEEELVGAVDYYIPYIVDGHCSSIPTVKTRHVDHCSNVHYKVKYEVLLVADEGYTRYLTFDYETEGHYSSTFFDQIEDLENVLEEMFEDGENDFTVEEGEKQVAFYNEVGEKTPISIYSISELTSMISSLRVIELEAKIIS